MNISRIMIILTTFVLLIACREYKIYGFNEVSIPTNQGEIELEIIPSRELIGTQKAIEANPYSLLFKYHSPTFFQNFTISELKIDDISFEPVSSLTSSTEKTGFSKNSEYWAIASLSDQLKKVELKHKEYNISFMFILKSNENLLH